MLLSSNLLKFFIMLECNVFLSSSTAKCVSSSLVSLSRVTFCSLTRSCWAHSHLGKLYLCYWQCFYFYCYWTLIPGLKGLIDEDTSASKTSYYYKNPENFYQPYCCGNVRESMYCGRLKKYPYPLHGYCTTVITHCCLHKGSLKRKINLGFPGSHTLKWEGPEFAHVVEYNVGCRYKQLRQC